MSIYVVPYVVRKIGFCPIVRYLKFWVSSGINALFKLANAVITHDLVTNLYLNASSGNWEILFWPKSKCLNESKPSTACWDNFVIWHPFKSSLLNLVKYLNGLSKRFKSNVFCRSSNSLRCLMASNGWEGTCLKKLLLSFKTWSELIPLKAS